ncbi:MAG: redoxin domain-containing protein [Acidobacteriaceae bacterium]|jgi:thiol-disulfide isomerase/thioredoxin
MLTGLLRVLLVSALVPTIALAQRKHVFILQFGSPVAGEPLSATRTLDYEPAVNSTDPVAYHAEEKVFRDSAGRMRSEIKYPNQLATVHIYDFVGHMYYQWTVGDTVVTSARINEAVWGANLSAPEKLDADAPLIEGIPVRHTHAVTGKESIEQSVDYWFAPSLHVDMVTVTDQPGVGKTTLRFVDVRVGEPDPALFRVPAGMTVEDNKQAPPPPVVAAANVPAGPVQTGAAVPAPGAAVPAYASDPKFQKALASAKEPRLPADERLARWKEANKIAKGQCEDCLEQMIRLQNAQSQWKDVVNAANQLDAIATTPSEKLFAESQRGSALLHNNNDEPKPEQVKEAEASLHAALAIAPKSANLAFLEGRALAMLGRDDEAKAMFQSYVDLVGMADPYRTRAEHFIENPRLAALRMAPAFTLTTSEGEQISLDDMGGKVVLLDFWATWCGPCKETLPEIQRIAGKFAGQPLVVLSISSDSDEAAWKTFVARNQMTWPQYRDANGALNRAYGVSTIPRFFTI